MTDLIQQIEAFCQSHEMSEWQFGEAVLNDRHLVRQIKTGRDMRMSTVERIRKFMAEYAPAAQASAA